MIIRKATEKDIPAIAGIYEEIHAREAAGETTTGWLRNVYPTKETAEASIARDDMFVQEDGQGNIVGTAIINRIQVDCYADGEWEYPAPDDEVMVIHTLIISDREGRRGSGHEFLQFYEEYAKYPHKCSECGGEMHVVTDKEVLMCPKCKNPLESTKEFIMWD